MTFFAGRPITENVVFARLARIVVVVALVATTGAHWALLQSVAWSTMLAENLSHNSVGVAMSRTFDGQHPCPICKAIAAGKKSEKKKDSTAQLQKFEFPLASMNLGLPSAPEFQRPLPSIIFPKVQSQTPPVPPPRLLPG